MKMFEKLAQNMEKLLADLGYVEGDLEYAGGGSTAGDSRDFKTENLPQKPCYFKNQTLEGVLDIYGSPLLCEFLIFHPQKHPDCLGVIVKFLEGENGFIEESQPKAESAGAGDKNGSEEEIFPYLIQSMQGNAMSFVLIVGGEGCSPEAKKWMDGECGDNLLGTFWWDEFENWAKDGGL